MLTEELSKFSVRILLSRALLLALGLCLPAALTSQFVFAQEVAVPADIQAVIFKKVFTYVRTLPPAGAPHLLILYDEGTTKSMGEIRKAFEQVRIDAVGVQEADLANGIQEGSIVYIATPRGSFRQQLQRTRSLSITGLPLLVQRGDASIGLALQDSKPKILVNLSQLKAEGHELASNLLQLAQVIQ